MHGRERIVPINVAEDSSNVEKSYYIFVLSGEESNDFFRVPEETFLIGSSFGCDFHLSDRKISPFSIEAKPCYSGNELKKLKITVLKGRIHIAGKAVKRCELKVGDFFRIKNTVFKLESVYPFEIDYRNLVVEKLKKGFILGKDDILHFFKKFFDISRKYHRPLSIILFKVDYFKLLKQTFSEKAIEQIYREARMILKKYIRKSDFIGRVEEDKYLIVLPETHHNGAVTVAKRLSSGIKNAVFRVGNESHTFTISQGVVSLDCHHYKTPIDFLNAGEKFLDKAAKKGKGIIEFCREINA